MKILVCLLLTLTFLFSLAACTAAEGETSDEPNTTAPVETAGPEESGAVTEPGTAAGPETPDPVAELDDAKLPTITSVKIRENDFAIENPTDEELTNFLCEALLYGYMLYRGYACVYSIPIIDEYVFFTDGSGGYQLDPLYVKNITYIRSVLSSYLKSSDDPIGWFFDKEEEPDGNVYVSEKYGQGTCDPALINIVERKDQDGIIIVTLAMYGGYDEFDEIECWIDTHTLQLIYEDGRWKVDADSLFDFIRTTISPPLREDFGTRLTLVKPD